MTVRDPGRAAAYAVLVLTAMNLLNYIDRYVPSAVKPLFQEDLKLSNAETSYPLSAFILVYMLASPVFGSLAERGRRTTLIAAGVALWSVATAAAAFANGFWTFLLARALVGVGEAAYAVIAPSLISDFYAPERRNRVLTIFYVAIPVGAAIGFTLGGVLGQYFSTSPGILPASFEGQGAWRAAFLICGLPGILVALLALVIREPPRGQFDDGPKLEPPPWSEALRALSRNKKYLVAVAGYTAVTFATGGIADWFPTFLARERGMDLAEAGGTVGTVTVLGGLVGTLAGGFLADRLKGRTRQPYLALCAMAMLPASILAGVALVVPGKTAIFGAILACQIFLWFYNGPINAILVNSVGPEMRARAFSLSILCIHLLGDAISPPIIGKISDLTGSLPLAVSIVPVALFVGACIWAYGWRRLDDDLTGR